MLDGLLLAIAVCVFSDWLRVIAESRGFGAQEKCHEYVRMLVVEGGGIEPAAVRAKPMEMKELSPDILCVQTTLRLLGRGESFSSPRVDQQTRAVLLQLT